MSSTSEDCSFEIADFAADQIEIVGFLCLPPNWQDLSEEELGSYTSGGPE